MADPRKAHVKRIHKIITDTDGNQTLAEDIWIDVLRIDKLPVIFQSTDQGVRGQIIVHNYKWNDDPNNPDPNIDASNADIQFENANANRKTEQFLVKDPNDPAATAADNGINLWIVDKLKVAMPKGGDEPGNQFVNFLFNNLPLDGTRGIPSNRTTSVIRIVNNDLNGMKMNADDGTPFIVDWDTYRQALIDGLSDPNDQLFLSVEFTDNFTIRFGADWLTGIVGQNIKYVLTANTPVENMFLKGDVNAVDADGNSALIRTDPLQVIVNVGLANIIAVEFPAGTS